MKIGGNSDQDPKQRHDNDNDNDLGGAKFCTLTAYCRTDSLEDATKQTKLAFVGLRIDQITDYYQATLRQLP